MPLHLRIARPLIITAFTVFIGACGSAKTDDEWMASAKEYLQKKDFKAATIQLKNLLASNPDSGEGHFLLGKSLLESGDAAGAQTEIERAMKRDYPQSAAIPLMARILSDRGESETVTDRYATVILHDDTADAELQTTVALAFSAQEKHGLARSAIDRAMRLAPRSTPVLLANARIKAAVADIDGALSTLADIISREPADFAAWQLKGYLLLRGKRDIEGAIEADTHALALKPADAQLHATLISLYLTQGDKTQAARQLAALQSVKPKDPLTLYSNAEFMFASGNFKGARESAQALLQKDPTNPAALRVAGAVELGSGSLSQAMDYLAQSVQLQPRSTEARILLAEAYLRSGRPAKTIAVLRSALEKTDADIDALLLAGRAYLLLDDPKTADALFKRVALTNPENAATRTLLAISRVAKGDHQTGLAALKSIASNGSTMDADLALISALMQQKDFAAALLAVDGLEKKQATSPLPADLRGRIFLLQHNLIAARKSFEEAGKRQPDYTFAVIKLAAIDLLQNQPAAAEQRLQSLIKLSPKNVEAWLALADLKRRSGGSSEEVVNLLVQAGNVDTSDAGPRIALIDYFFARGDTDSAATAAQAAVTAIPQSAELLDKLARVALARHDLDGATRAFKKLVLDQPDSPLGFQGLSEIGVATKDYQLAEQNSKRALELAPKSLAARQISIIASLNLKRPDAALAQAKLIQEQNSDDALGYIWEGDIHVASKHWSLAVPAFRKALTKHQPAQAAMKLHSALISDKKQLDASKFSATWTDLHPDDLVFLAYLAESATRQQDLPLAESHYRRMLRVQPQNSLALNNLAWLLIRQERVGGVALAMRALDTAPEQVEMMDTLAMAYSVENQHAKALDMEKRVIALSPRVSAFHLTLAKIYIRMGEKALAKAELNGLTDLKVREKEEAAALLRSLV